jgi:peptide/nickel transport system permease protein
VISGAAKSGRGIVGLLLVGLVVAIAVLGPLVAPHSPTSFVTSTFAKPSASSPFGGDVLGRDVLSRVLEGGWVLLLLAAAGTLIGVVVGATAGIVAAYFGGWTDGIIMRSVDVVLAIPGLVFVLLLVSVIGPKLWLIVLAVGASHAPQVARVMRSASFDVSERDFVKSVKLLGVPSWKVISREILPNLTSVLMVEAGLRLTYSILIIAGLSFLGFGLQPPAPNWGLMINENRIGLVANPWGVVVPTGLIALLTVGMNIFTDSVARVAIGVNRPLAKELFLEGIPLDVP